MWMDKVQLVAFYWA